MIAQPQTSHGYSGERGASAVELALLLPLILVIVFGVIEIGQFITARFIIINVAREGASLASRDIQSAADLIGLMQNAATPLDLADQGRIYVTKILAGQTSSNPSPAVDATRSAFAGALDVPSSVSGSNFGLTAAVYGHLVFDDSPSQMTADIAEVTVVDVFYLYTPITPLSNFIPGLMTSDGGGRIMHSRAVF